jgi:hypothetical protein
MATDSDSTHVARVDLTSAAAMLHMTYQRCRDTVLRGDLDGARGPDGKWTVDAADLARLVRQRSGPGRSTVEPG